MYQTNRLKNLINLCNVNIILKKIKAISIQTSITLYYLYHYILFAQY